MAGDRQAGPLTGTPWAALGAAGLAIVGFAFARNVAGPRSASASAGAAAATASGFPQPAHDRATQPAAEMAGSSPTSRVADELRDLRGAATPFPIAALAPAAGVTRDARAAGQADATGPAAAPDAATAATPRELPHCDAAGGGRGWCLKGDRDLYEAGRDAAVKAQGQSSLYLWRVDDEADGFGSLRKEISAEPYRGQRIRVRALLQTQGVDNAGLWVKVDDAPARGAFAAGDLPWQWRSVTLDVPPDAQTVAFGVSLRGSGAIWMDDVRIARLGAAGDPAP